MRAIAAELARLSGRLDGRGDAEPASDERGPGDALRDAVAQIARRQAHLDADWPSRRSDSPADGAPGASRRPPSEEPSPSDAALPPAWRGRGTSELSAEVSQTFARFSRDLREAVAAIDARPRVDALDHKLSDIARSVDGLGIGLARADALAAIGERTQEMRDLLMTSARVADPLDGLDRQVTALEGRLSRLAAGPAPVRAASFGSTTLDGSEPSSALAALEARLAELTAQVERGFETQGSTELIESLSRRVDEIHGSLHDRLSGAALDTGPLEDLVRGLSDRIEQARGASTDFRQLEAAMRDAASRIDVARAGADPGSVKALEAQLARVADRLERSETSLRSLDGVEHSLGELFSQFEVTRQVAMDAAETAARTAARDTLRAALQNPGLAARPHEGSTALGDQVGRILEEFRARQDTSERRTQGTLADIQAALERLIRGEGAIAGVGAPPRRERAAPTGEPSVRIDPADQLIEPGSGRAPPTRARGEAPATVEPREPALGALAGEGEGPAGFIAAARRAAQTAHASAAVAVADRGERRATGRAPRPGRRPAGEAADPLGRAKRFLARRRRPLLLGITAVVVLVWALDLVHLSSHPSAAPQAGAAQAPATGMSRSADLAPAPPKPASGPPLADEAVLPPSGTAPRPALPSFVTGPAKAQQQAAYDGVPQALRDRAAAGDPAAEYEIGTRYADGRSVAHDARQAAAWFAKASAGGLAPAEYRLGSLYEKGVGVDRDPALAVAWYTKAAEAGNVRAMHNLAVMSAEGAGGKPDYAKAAQWFGKASTYGVRDSQFNLAILYARGLGIEQSLAQSFTWFSIAAAEGDEDAGRKRDEVASKLDPMALASAKAAAEAFRAGVPQASANDVAPPTGGWDAATNPPAPPAGSRVSQL